MVSDRRGVARSAFRVGRVVVIVSLAATMMSASDQNPREWRDYGACNHRNRHDPAVEQPSQHKRQHQHENWYHCGESSLGKITNTQQQPQHNVVAIGRRSTPHANQHSRCSHQQRQYQAVAVLKPPQLGHAQPCPQNDAISRKVRKNRVCGWALPLLPFRGEPFPCRESQTK